MSARRKAKRPAAPVTVGETYETACMWIVEAGARITIAKRGCTGELRASLTWGAEGDATSVTVADDVAGFDTTIVKLVSMARAAYSVVADDCPF